MYPAKNISHTLSRGKCYDFSVVHHHHRGRLFLLNRSTAVVLCGIYSVVPAPVFRTPKYGFEFKTLTVDNDII